MHLSINLLKNTHRIVFLYPCYILQWLVYIAVNNCMLKSPGTTEKIDFYIETSNIQTIFHANEANFCFCYLFPPRLSWPSRGAWRSTPSWAPPGQRVPPRPPSRGRRRSGLPSTATPNCARSSCRRPRTWTTRPSSAKVGTHCHHNSYLQMKSLKNECITEPR